MTRKPVGVSTVIEFGLNYYPSLLPMQLRSWQGNPPTTRSTFSETVILSTFLTSPTWCTSGYFAFRTSSAGMLWKSDEGSCHSGFWLHILLLSNSVCVHVQQTRTDDKHVCIVKQKDSDKIYGKLRFISSSFSNLLWSWFLIFSVNKFVHLWLWRSKLHRF